MEPLSSNDATTLKQSSKQSHSLPSSEISSPSSSVNPETPVSTFPPTLSNACVSGASSRITVTSVIPESSHHVKPPVLVSPCESSVRERKLKQILEQHRADRARIQQRTRSLYGLRLSSERQSSIPLSSPSSSQSCAPYPSHSLSSSQQSTEEKLQAAIVELCRIEREFKSFQLAARSKQDQLRKENEQFRQRLIALGEQVPPAVCLSFPAWPDKSSSNGNTRASSSRETPTSAVSKDSDGRLSNDKERRLSLKHRLPDLCRSVARAQQQARAPTPTPSPTGKRSEQRNVIRTKSNALFSKASHSGSELSKKAVEEELQVDELVSAIIPKRGSNETSKKRSGSIRAGLKWLEINNRRNVIENRLVGSSDEVSMLHASTRDPSLDDKENEADRRATRLAKSFSRKWSTCF